jgi:hypothetical protein
MAYIERDRPPERELPRRPPRPLERRLELERLEPDRPERPVLTRPERAPLDRLELDRLDGDRDPERPDERIADDRLEDDSPDFDVARRPRVAPLRPSRLELDELRLLAALRPRRAPVLVRPRLDPEPLPLRPMSSSSLPVPSYLASVLMPPSSSSSSSRSSFDSSRRSKPASSSMTSSRSAVSSSTPMACGRAPRELEERFFDVPLELALEPLVDRARSPLLSSSIESRLTSLLKLLGSPRAVFS